MPRDGALSRNAGERSERRQPAAQAAIDDWDVPQKDEIAGKQRLSGLVQKREVIVRMGSAPRTKRQGAVAEIELGLTVDLLLRCNKLDVGQHVAHDASECVEVERSAHRECAWQIAMTDEYRTLPGKGGIAEHVIRMGMGVDYVADRLCGDGADRSEQPPS